MGILMMKSVNSTLNVEEPRYFVNSPSRRRRRHSLPPINAVAGVHLQTLPQAGLSYQAGRHASARGVPFFIADRFMDKP
jgi:hypothetical protein